MFIYGTGSDLRVKPNVLDGLLPKHFEVLTYDQRGLGRTAVPDGPYSMQDYAHDAAALLDALGWDRCPGMGVSFGGMVAQEFALRHPDRVERLVLACTSSGGAGEASYPLHELADLPFEERVRQTLRISDTRSAGVERDHPDQFEALLQEALGRMSVGAAEPDREKGRRLQLEARRHHDTFDRLPALTMPVLICAGKYDGIASPANSEALHRQIPASSLEFFEGGHLFLREVPSAIERIIEFLRASA